MLVSIYPVYLQHRKQLTWHFITKFVCNRSTYCFRYCIYCIKQPSYMLCVSISTVHLVYLDINNYFSSIFLVIIFSWEMNWLLLKSTTIICTWPQYYTTTSLAAILLRAYTLCIHLSRLIYTSSMSSIVDCVALRCRNTGHFISCIIYCDPAVTPW